MSVTIQRKGYGQVEPNHLSAPRNGQVYAQLPADLETMSIEALEQGMFVKYDEAAGKCNFTGDGEWMLVYNEEKLYDERHQMHRDFAMTKADAYNGIVVPRVFKTNIGDIYTTNMVKNEAIEKDSYLVVDTNGVLKKATGTTLGSDDLTGMVWKVVKETTMPDMQPAVKLQRVQ